MLTRHLTTKILDIRLEEEKFYFPGETIKGEIIVHPKSTIKVNCINLKFSGEVYIHLKEKELNTLFQDLLVLPEPKQTTLDSGVDHAFPFEFIVPKHLNLPSSMEFGKKGHIRYTITAVLDRPMLLESLCPKVDYVVSLLEYIDIEREQFKIPQEKSQDLMLPQAKYNQKCMVRASMPRLGFTRGDIVPLKVTIDHFTSYSRKDGVTVELVRTVEIRTLRHTVFKETALRKTPYLLDIKSPAYNQSILCQLLIPTSTPPSLRYKDKVLRFHYKVRVTVHFGDGNNSQIILDMPIVVGTWPRASVPIEDDDDTLDMEDSIQSGEEEEEDVTDDTDIESLRTCSIEDNASRRSSTGWNNSSNITLNGGGVSNNNRNSSSIIVENTLVGRSDSVASKASNRSFNSISSWKSSRSWDQQQQQQPYYPYHQQYNHSANSLSRNTSSASHHQSHHRSSSIYSNDSSTLYPNSVSSNTNNMNRHSAGSSTSNGSVTSLQQQQQQFYNRQLPPTMGIVTGYGGYGNGGYSNNNPNRLSRYSNRHEDDPPATPTSIQLENDVPTHILEPISSPNPPATTNTSATGGFVPLTSPIHELQESDYNNTTTQPTTSSCNESLSSLSPSEDEDEDDSDEDDLLAIIERKKKKERRDLKKKRLAEKKAAASATVPPVVLEAADNA